LLAPCHGWPNLPAMTKSKRPIFSLLALYCRFAVEVTWAGDVMRGTSRA
jgi:hypothetical protein